ncbi:MAG: hypothetical protein J6X24_04605, partial [Firmicutes bacterium]|nr:hypothetical protein [Bacillota bacterium]
SAEDFCDILKEELAGDEGIRDLQPSWSEEEIAKLQERYEDPRWTFGYPPSYEETREERLPGGLVRVHLRMEEGRIADIAFSGDFFCAGDPEDLCRLLRGRRIDADLLTLLGESPQARCIRGAAPSDLYRLIAG